MNIKYKELEIDLALEGIIQVEQFCLEEGLNRHSYLSLKLLAEAEQAEEIVTRASVEPVVVIETERTGGRIIFQGKVEAIRMEVERGLPYLYLEVYSYSKEWDRVEKSQSFLNGADTYLAVAEKAVSEYSGADIKDEVTGGALIPEMLLQYEETDWVFLRRLASHFGSYLIPDTSADHARVYLGIPQITYGIELSREDYVLTKDMGHYAKVLMPEEILSQEASKWQIKSRLYLWMGEEVSLNGIVVIVTGTHIGTEDGELVYRYELSRRDGIRREKEKNPRIYGMSIPATVKERSGNRIRVHFDIDPVYEAAEQTKYFTYAIESSSFYCMPEEDSRVHIYFPDHDEQGAIAVHAIGSSSGGGSGGGGGGGKNPDNKRFSDPSGSAMDMTPENICFAADDSGSLLLYLGSDGNISLMGKDVNISTQQGVMVGDGEEGPTKKLFISGDKMVSLKIGEGGDEGITLDTEANIIAAFIKQSATTVTAAEPSKSQLEADMAAQDKESRDANNTAIKDSMVAQKKESKQKIVKGLKSIATVIGAVALTVISGGTLGPVMIGLAVAKTAIAVSDIAEGMDGYSKMNSLDTSRPANFIRDKCFGGNQMAYDLFSTGVDIAFDLVSGKALKNAGAMSKLDTLLCGKGQQVEKYIKIGVNVIGGMAEDYLTTGKIDIKNMVINGAIGYIKGTLGTSLKMNILSDFNFNSKALEKIAGVVIGTAVDTVLDLGLNSLFQRDVNITQCITNNFLANGLAAIFGEPIDAVTGAFLMTATDFVLSDIRDPIRITRRYNSAGHQTGVMGQGWTFAYEGRLYRDGNRCHVELETGHHIMFEQEGDQFKNSTSGCGWFSLKKDADSWRLYDKKNHRTHYYDRTGLLTAIEDQNGQAMKFTYRGDTLERITTALGYCLDFMFREGRLVQISDHIGRTMQYRYESGILTDVVHMDQGITHYDYDSHGHLVKATDQAGVTYLENQYDEQGRVVLQTLANGDTYQAEYLEGERRNIVHSSVGDKTIIHTYSKEGQPLSEEHQDGTGIWYQYDDQGYRIAETGRLGRQTVWHYDGSGRVTEEQKPGGLVTTYQYDGEDNQVHISDNASREWRYTYDQNHNLCQKQEKTGRGSRWAVYGYEYDRKGRVISFTDPLGNQTVYSYEEDGGKPVLMHLPDGEEVVFEYDGAGRKLAEAGTSGRIEYGYNARNFRTLLRDGEGNETRYMYDGMGRLLALYQPKAWKAQRGEYSYRYDFLDRLIDTTRPDGSHERQIRDGEGHILKKVHPNAYDKSMDDGEGIRYDYDSDGNQIRIHYPDGGCERMSYNAEGKRIKHVLPEAYHPGMDDGEGYTYEYDSAGNLTKATAPEGTTEAVYTYDPCGNVLSYCDALGRMSYFRYDNRKNLTQVLRPAREQEGQILYQRITFSYDDNGNKKKETRHGGYWNREGQLVAEDGTDLCLTFAYNVRNRLIRVEDGSGASVRYRYDVRGNRTYEERQISDTVKQAVHYGYDRAGRLIEEKEELSSGLEPAAGEARSAITRYRYDENGNRTEITTPEGYRILREYDDCDRMISERSIDKANGIDRTVSVNYDKAGNITKIARQGKGCESWDICYDYDLKDRITHVKDCLGPVFQYEYQKNDKVAKTILPPAGQNQELPRGYQYRYDYRGNLLERMDTAGTVLEQNEYLPDGKLARKATADGNELSYVYGLNGREESLSTARSRQQDQAAQTYTYDSRGRITGLADGNRNQTGYAVDGWGRIHQVQGADDGREGYTYDYAGNITSTTDAKGGVITYRYNSQGKVCEIIDQEGRSETFRYDREGRMILHVDRNSNQVRTTYNMDGNPVLESGHDSEGQNTVTRSWEYNGLGQTVKSVAGGFCYTYEYRPDGKLIKKVGSGRTLISCTYYPDGSLKALTDESGKTVTYGYDWKGNLNSITDEAGTEIVTYQHYPDGKLKEIRHFNGVETHYEYDTDGNISRLATLLNSKELLCDFQYDYDLNGNRTAKAGPGLFPGEQGVKDTMIRYQYDSMNRLLEEDYDGESITYRYDLCGNRMEKESLARRETYCYNNRNQLTERSTSKGRTFYQYDHQGNLAEETGAERRTYSYNQFNQQTRVEGEDGFIQENFYDGEYLRAGIKTKEDSSQFVFYRGELLTESTGAESLRSRHILGYGVAASEVDGATGYHAYHLDEQNSTAYITGSQKQVESAYAYDAFGGLRGQAGELLNRILYTGQQYDQELGQYYLRARYYNPVLGRFTKEDVYRGDGLNLYVYCHNNPVTYYDPSGYTTRAERGTTKDSNGLLMGDTGYGGTLPTNSWTLTSDGMGAHLYERGNIADRNAMGVFDQPNTPTYYPYGTEENAGQAHLRLHDATAGEGVKLSGGNSNLSDSELMNSYERAYSSEDLQNIRGDLRTGDGSVVVATNVTPEEAFAKLNEWGMENDEDFKNFREEEMKKQKEEESADDGKCNS